MNLYNYLTYIEYIDKTLEKFFKEQSPYIFCKKGCAKCCKHGTYPFTQLEFRYLMFGYNKLEPDRKKIIRNKILNVIEEKITFDGEKFLYECPFLIDNACALYQYRGILCRTFGLMWWEENNSKINIPFCAFEGLNYSNVLDENTKTLSAAKFLNSGFEQEPIAHNVCYKFLTDKQHEMKYNINFGEVRQLIDWLTEEFKLQ